MGLQRRNLEVIKCRHHGYVSKSPNSEDALQHKWQMSESWFTAKVFGLKEPTQTQTQRVSPDSPQPPNSAEMKPGWVWKTMLLLK